MISGVRVVPGRRIVEDHVARCQPSVERRFSVSLPLIPASETGPIRPITGKDVDCTALGSDDARQATPLEQVTRAFCRETGPR